MRRAVTLVLALFAALAFAPAASAKRVALVVGINSYDNLRPELQLKKALNDSRAVANALSDIGFQVVLASDTSRNDFLRAWQRFLNMVQPADETAIYFAGHGFEVNGNNYLLVRDAPEVADGEEVLKESAIRVGKLIDTLKDKQARVSLYILDACRDNPYANSRSTRSVGMPRGLAREDAPNGALIMMSAATGQQALDALSASDPDPNSVYTRTLVPLLKQPGLEIIDLAKKVRSDVEALAATVQHEQRPAFYDELSGNYFLVPGPQTPQAAISAAPILSDAAQAWAVTKDTTSQAVLETFIQRFGATFYGDMARARLNELKGTQTARLTPPAAAVPSRPAPKPAETSVPPLDEAAQAWAGIQSTRDTVVLESFIRQFGTSSSAALARARLEELKRANPVIAAPVAPPAARTEPAVASSPKPPTAFEAAQAWLAVKASNNPADPEAFLGRYGQSIYGDMARARVSELRKTQRIAVATPTARAPAVTDPAAAPAQPNPPAAGSKPPSAYESAHAWLAVKATNDPADLEAFLGRYGDSIYGDMARARLRVLKQTQQVAVAAPIAPTLESNRPALASPPPAPAAGDSVPPSAYESAQAWLAVKATNNPADLETFLRRYGGSIYGDMARARLRDLQKTQPQVAVAAPVARGPAPLAAAPPANRPAASSAEPLTAAQAQALKPGDLFKECAQCPQMTVVPAGTFTMGSPAREQGRSADEGPPYQVTIARPFAVGVFSVTYDEWDACVSAGGCNGYRPTDAARQRGRYPVVNVSWDDAKAYLAWLSKTTGKSYRLLSEAEREYVARAGATTPFWFGSSISTKLANYDGGSTYAGGEKGEFRGRTVLVDAFAPNPFGLYQTSGNVYDWVEDCWHANYQGAPHDGAAQVTGDCGRRVMRGGSWFDPPAMLRAAHRAGFFPDYRSDKIGFRVARSL